MLSFLDRTNLSLSKKNFLLLYGSAGMNVAWVSLLARLKKTLFRQQTGLYWLLPNATFSEEEEEEQEEEEEKEEEEEEDEEEEEKSYQSGPYTYR